MIQWETLMNGSWEKLNDSFPLYLSLHHPHETIGKTHELSPLSHGGGASFPHGLMGWGKFSPLSHEGGETIGKLTEFSPSSPYP